MLRVLEIGGYWAGPLVGHILTALGCDVIRLEASERPMPYGSLPAPRLGGRKIQGVTRDDNPMHGQLSAGKRSVSFDLNEASGYAAARQLAATCDVVIENLGPHKVKMLGLGYATLSRDNPGLCMLSLPALHEDDPRSSLRGYAPMFTAIGGLERLVGYDDGPTGMLRTAIGDPNGAITGFVGLVSALVRRETTGLGSRVVASQVKAVTYQLVEPFSQWQRSEFDPEVDVPTAPRRKWSRVCATSDPLAWVAAEGSRVIVGDLAQRLHVRGIDEVEPWAARNPADIVLREFRAAGLAVAPVRRIDEYSSSRHAIDRGMVAVEPSVGLGDVSRFAVPWLIGGHGPIVLGRGPRVGEHTEDLRDELGLRA